MDTKNAPAVFTEQTANPAPLGLLGFGLTTVLLNLHNAGFIELSAMILSMGIFMGGLAQVIAGIQEWKKNNTFGATAFTAYGMFWLSLVALILLPNTSFASGMKTSSDGMGWYLLMWGIFTACMFIGTLKANRLLQVIFFTLTILFFLLAAADFTGNTAIKTFAGYEGIFCGLAAMYGTAAQVINEVYGKEVLPIGTK